MQTCLNIAHCKILPWPHFPFQQPSYYSLHPPSKTSWKAYLYSLSPVSLTVFFLRSLFFSYQALSLLLHKNSFVRVTTDLTNPHLPLDSTYQFFLLDTLYSLGFWAPHCSDCLLPTDSVSVVVWLHLEELMTLDCPRALSLDFIPFFHLLTLWVFS